MDIYEAVARRKSVRAFTDQDVPVDVLDRVFNAARMAASASNRQEWRYVVVRDPALRRKVAVAASEQVHVAQAPVILACCADTDEHIMPCGQQSYPIDVAIATTHITLCAAAEGLGTCWIGAFDENGVKEILGIPQPIRVVALMPVGFPRDPEPVEKMRLPLKTIVKYDQWSA